MQEAFFLAPAKYDSFKVWQFQLATPRLQIAPRKMLHTIFSLGGDGGWGRERGKKRGKTTGLARTWGATAQAARRGCSSSRWSGTSFRPRLLPVRTVLRSSSLHPASALRRTSRRALLQRHNNMVAGREGDGKHVQVAFEERNFTPAKCTSGALITPVITPPPCPHVSVYVLCV